MAEIITIYESESAESRLYDAIAAVIDREEFGGMRMWSVIGVLEILKMNLNGVMSGE